VWITETPITRPDGKRFAEIVDWQERRQTDWRTVPTEGSYVVFNGLSFRVFPGVFWPFEDSLPLIEKMKIQQGDDVLDVGTGAGTIAVHAARKGAEHVVAIDRNPDAVRAAQINGEHLVKSGQMEALVSDVFDAINGNRFDVITANLPWLDRPGKDDVEAAQWDTNFESTQKFFAGLRDHLKPNGRAYYAQGNYGAIDKSFDLMQSNGLSYRLVGRKRAFASPDLEYFVFELTT